MPPIFPSLSSGRSGPPWLNRITAAVRARIRRNPTLYFGAPFVLSIVGASFLLTSLTETRYIRQDAHVRLMSKEEALNLRTNRRKLDIREEYFRMQSGSENLDDWEPVRVARPKGVPEWGGVPDEPAPGQEPVAADYSPESRSSFFSRRAVQAEESDEPPAPLKSGVSHGKPVVLGPDGKPCRACNSKLAFMSATRQTRAPAVSKKADDDARRTAPAAASDPCPPDVEELGHSTWTFLHSAAAYYPDTPSAEQREAMLALLSALPHVYPCSMCAAELRSEYARQQTTADTKEAAVASGPALRRWLCGLHNGVNERLGKPMWDCADAERLRGRWYEPPADRECV
ncbi:thiol oxidase [Malassezia cuniculi]|uniref:Sulfhydryl oxidase n=1 Tax=Malassezia cuniculi TaxID=948313 RepID=A0AAF0EW11_9BASI|nr:thiol oxidase [Malassezia cuniculi]